MCTARAVLQVLKNQLQASGSDAKAGWVAKASAVLKSRGIIGLYRGIGPGLLRSIVANGGSMVVYSTCCKLMRGP